MAKVISDIYHGRKITLELTEQELATIVYATGIAKFADLEREAVGYEMPCLGSLEHYKLWESLEHILFEKEAVVSQQRQ